MEEEVKALVLQLKNKYGDDPQLRSQLKCLISREMEQTFEEEPKKEKKGKPTRVYVDGCFDIMHSGHYNALRQAKQLGDILVVGVHSDEEILRNKGPTTFKEDERVRLVKACKWVDEVAFGVPYSPTIELLDELNCDFGVHGDDMPTNASGESAYARIIQAGRCKIIKRTEGVSTTTLVGRLLLCTREHHLPQDEETKDMQVKVGSPFLPTTQRIYQFSKFADKAYAESYSSLEPKNVVYIDGSLDLFHVGHIDLLEKAKSLGDFLLVGIHNDKTVNEHKGKNFPIMNLHERVLNVLSCKVVDDVILGAPWELSEDAIATLHIKVVVSAHKMDYNEDPKESDPYAVPKSMGIYREIENFDMTTDTIVERILCNRENYEQVYEAKKKKQDDYIATSKEWRKDLREL